jgi:hypothetical protein
MSTITTRAVKGAPLSWAEADANFNNLNTDKLEASDIGVAVQAYDANLTTWAGVTPGTGIATALAVDVGTAGSPVVNGGALGTPSSGTLTNATGLPAAGVTGTALVAAAIGTTVQAYDADTAKLDVAQAFTAAQTFPAGHQTTGAVLFGYGTGAGDTVTQLTNKSTAVTLNKPCGQIITNNANLAAGFSVAFVLNNSLIAATDTVVTTSSGTLGGNYRIDAYNVAAGSVVIRILSVSGSPLTDAIPINFAVIKSVTS